MGSRTVRAMPSGVGARVGEVSDVGVGVGNRLDSEMAGVGVALAVGVAIAAGVIVGVVGVGVAGAVAVTPCNVSCSAAWSRDALMVTSGEIAVSAAGALTVRSGAAVPRSGPPQPPIAMPTAMIEVKNHNSRHLAPASIR